MISAHSRELPPMHRGLVVVGPRATVRAGRTRPEPRSTTARCRRARRPGRTGRHRTDGVGRSRGPAYQPNARPVRDRSAQRTPGLRSRRNLTLGLFADAGTGDDGPRVQVAGREGSLPMRVNRGLLGWGVFFIVLGAVPLAVQAGARRPRGRPARLGAVAADPDRHRARPGPGQRTQAGDPRRPRRRRHLRPHGRRRSSRRASARWAGSTLVRVRRRAASGDAVPDPDRHASAATRRCSIEMNCGEVDAARPTASGWSVTGTSDDGQPPEVTATGDTARRARAPSERASTSPPIPGAGR